MNESFDKIVQKLWKNKSSIYTTDQIKTWLQTIQWDQKNIYKIIHRLRATGVISTIRNGLYIRWDDTQWEDYYWEIVKKLTKTCAYSEGILGGYNAASVYLWDHSLPEKLTIITRNTNKIITISGPYLIHFRTIKQNKNKNIFPQIWSNRSPQEIDKVRIWLPNKEIALLELLTIRSTSIQNIDMIVKNFLRRYHNKIDISALEKIIDIKYITALNRLREYTKNEEYTELYRNILKIIHKNGKGCFISINL